MSRILVVDLEATCSDDGSITPDDMEIIEIGACWTTETGVVLERFQHLVKPLIRPTLTPFCKKLVGITQEEIDRAPSFPVAAAALAAFVDESKGDDAVWMSWGNYDFNRAPRHCHAIDDASQERQALVCKGAADRKRGRHGPGVRASGHRIGGAAPPWIG